MDQVNGIITGLLSQPVGKTLGKPNGQLQLISQRPPSVRRRLLQDHREVVFFCFNALIRPITLKLNRTNAT